MFTLVAVLTALSVALWLSALNVRYRDVGHAIPFLIQLWLFASPVAHPVSMIPDRWRLLYSLNPMAGVIDGFRWALLGNQRPDFGVIGTSFLMVVDPAAARTHLFQAHRAYVSRMLCSSSWCRVHRCTHVPHTALDDDACFWGQLAQRKEATPHGCTFSRYCLSWGGRNCGGLFVRTTQEIKL